MTKTIFDHLKGVTCNKVRWEELSDADKKTWDDFMITRWLSMKVDYLEFLNEIQLYRSAGIEGETYYNLLFHVLPKESTYYKYTKRPRTFEEKKNLLKFFSLVYKVSFRECLDIINLFRKLNKQSEFELLLEKYGVQTEDRETLKKELFNDKQ